MTFLRIGSNNLSNFGYLTFIENRMSKKTLVLSLGGKILMILIRVMIIVVLPWLSSLVPPGIWPVQETHSGKGAAKGDLSKKPLSNSGGTKLDNNGKLVEIKGFEVFSQRQVVAKDSGKSSSFTGKQKPYNNQKVILMSK